MYTFSFFLQDLLAGFTVALTEIPQGIAYATIAGLPSEYGLYSGLMGGWIYFIFGKCKDINVGPTAIMALLVQPSVITMGPDGAVLLCFLSGLLILLTGILRLGFIVEFFSYPVISGFITAAALNIACSQLNPILGITGSAKQFLQGWISLFNHINEVKMWDTVLGLASMFCLLIFREIRKYGSLKNKSEWSRERNVLGKFIFFLSLSGNALAVVTGTTIAYVADTRYNATPFVVTGSVAAGFPTIGFPPFSTSWNSTYFGFTDMLSEYGALVAFCPMVAFLEHIAIVKAFSKGKIIDATQELIALGISNMAGSLIHSMPVTGSFTRTAVNNASGVRTTTAGLITSMILLVSLALLTGIFTYIPKATLAAVIMVSMFYLWDFHEIAVLWRTKRVDLIPFFTTLVFSLLINLEYGILIGIATSLAFILYDSARPKLFIERDVIQNKVVYLVRPKSGLYFTSSEYIRELILKDCSEEKSTVVIDGQFVRNIDATIAQSFVHLLDDLNFRNQKLIFWNFSKLVLDICTGHNKKLTRHFRNGSLDKIFAGPSRLSAITSLQGT